MIPTIIHYCWLSGEEYPESLRRCLDTWYKHFESFGQAIYDNPHTVISREYSTEWMDGMEPFYPVNDEKDNSLYLKYKALADAGPNVIVGGRLAEYKY